tara:strand:- start:184 stop:375 length:192 start_codon:yes stop_codon:yes gene_type:complete
MGRVKTAMVKRKSREIYAQAPEKFKETFDENKKVVEEFAQFQSKKLRNVIAGYITRLVKHDRQ